MLIFTAAVATNELMIKSMRGASRIEASNRAFLIAEGGIEDALYELSPHLAGYKTPELDHANVRTNDFTVSEVNWKNYWNIESLSGANTFQEKLYDQGKLIISLYNDDSGDIDAGVNSINTAAVNTFKLIGIDGNFSVSFTIPASVVSLGIDTSGVLLIDQDNEGGVNEDPDDGILSPCTFGGKTVQTEDNDCDGQNNEDGPDAPIIFWKLSDGHGNTLSPVRGCLGVSAGSEICENDFNTTTLDPFSVMINQSTIGVPNTGGPNESIGTFLSNAVDPAKPQIEFFIVSPLIHKDITLFKEIAIPYFEVEISSGTSVVPRPYFTIQSDGYYQDFKQSINTTVTPRTLAPLFDFTVIQQ